MGGSKPKPSPPLPFQQQQQNTFSLYGPGGSQEAKDLLDVNLDFGGGNYLGDAYKDYGGNAFQGIKNDFKFDVDPGVGRRTALAEQGAMNRWDNSLMSGVPAFLRQSAKARELRDIRGQGAAEAQQAEFTRQNAQQQAEYQSSLARAGMQDAAELNRARFRDESERARAGMLDQATGQRTAAELERRRLLVPQVVQTGGNSSGYNTQIMPGQQGIFGSLLQGAGSAIGGLAAGGLI